MRGTIAPAGDGAPHYASATLSPRHDGMIELSNDVMEFTKTAPGVVGQRHEFV